MTPTRRVIRNHGAVADHQLTTAQAEFRARTIIHIFVLVVHAELAGWLDAEIGDIGVSREARAYLVSTLDRVSRDPHLDMSDSSIILSYASAAGFPDFQRIGDWVLFRASILPTCNDRIAIDFGRLAYARCYRIVRSWRVYDELSDDLPRVVAEIRSRVRASTTDPMV